MAGCGGESTVAPPPPPPPSPSCSSVTPLQLAPGDHQVLDPAQTGGCVRVPQAGSNGAEYLVVVASTSGEETQAGVQGAYTLRAGNPGASASAELTGQLAPSPAVPSTPSSAADRFHLMLRERERALAADPRYRAGPLAAPGVPAAVPQVGDQLTFKSCSTLDCNQFVSVTATVKFVGTHSIILVDNNAPQNDPLQPADFQELGSAFDNRDHPIDVTSFGAESDIDNNQHVLILLTKAVNDLTPDCTNGRILGYFFGGDLLTTFANSNKAEVFYTFVPAPATAKCTASSRRQVLDNVKPTLIHEFQHMISFNQHVLLRGGEAEQTWLNEAFSHFAEELGGRLIPDAECAGFSSCRSQYASGDLLNLKDYLEDTEGNFLVYPGSSNGTLAERGASWFFLRWVIDQFASDTLLGTDLTPRMVQTGLLGAANVTAVSGESFSTLVPQWLLAVYLDDLAGFSSASPRMRVKSWNYRAIAENPANGQLFPNGFPLKPDSTSGSYTRSGTLRGGSGRHFRLIQQANGAGIDVQVLKNTAGAALDAALVARIGIVRIR